MVNKVYSAVFIFLVLTLSFVSALTVGHTVERKDFIITGQVVDEGNQNFNESNFSEENCDFSPCVDEPLFSRFINWLARIF
jgi:hypothetical protein